jgi:hypothetical protein
MRHATHLSDEELLLLADGELSWRRTAHVRLHLAFCRACRARFLELKTAMAGYARAYRATLDPQLPPVVHAPAFWPLPAAALIVVAVLAALVWHFSSPRRQSMALVREGAIPRTDLTPGATRFIDRARACTLADNVPGIPEALKRRVLQEYGIDEAAADRYEIDFLITPALGGSDSLRNLWPEPYFRTNWNAHVKDALEDHFHAMVCTGQIDLPTAQREIAQNWVAAYQKYFHTRAPLATYSLLDGRSGLPARAFMRD